MITEIIKQTWNLLLEAAPFMLFGLFAGGLVKVFIGTSAVARHLGRGRFSSVFKAALIGIPLPLCSCGVLPAAAALKKQGANNGATTAFLISTPESGLDSISVTYALLDPVMTVARPVAAFFTAMVAGLSENLRQEPSDTLIVPDQPCPVDGCCDGNGCEPEIHRHHHRFGEKLAASINYAFIELWDELAVWFLVGMILAGVISALVPDEFISNYLGGGLVSMLTMLVVGIPLYICASASTPIAAALLLKGASPGAVLIFLLAGPATNIASLAMLKGLLGRRATLLYLGAIIGGSLISGLAVNLFYELAGMSPRAMIGTAADSLPKALSVGSAVTLLILSARPVYRRIRALFSRRRKESCGCGHHH